MKIQDISFSKEGETYIVYQTLALDGAEYVELLGELQHSPELLVSRDAHLAVPSVEPEVEAKPKRKRRTKDEIAADEAAAEAAKTEEAPEEAPEEEAPAEEEAPKRGGRRGSKAKVEPEQTSDDDEARPKRGGRRGKKAEAEPVEEAPAEEEEVESDVTDSDLTKACSAAAKKIEAPAVKDIIKSYGVEKVNELKGADRQAFLNELDEAVEAVDEESGY
jgi:hypothetical protein